MEHPTKASLRIEARKLLASLSLVARAAASAQIRRRIEALPEWESARTVALYAAQSSEPDLSGLVGTPEKAFCFPRVTGNNLEFHRCDSIDNLRPGPWNLLEPDPQHCPTVPVSEIDLILIPGLSFTRTGGRLGRGGGFYDRFLGQLRPSATKIGICFHAQLVPTLPLELHDHEVNLVITDENVIRCPKGTGYSKS